MNQLRASLTRTILLAAASIFVVAICCAPASAATSVGYPLADASPDAWQAGSIVTQRRNLDVAGTTYGGFTVGGVLTSVSVRTQNDALVIGDSVIGVSVLRKTADPTATTATFLSVGATDIAVTADPSPTGHVTTVPARIPVSVGDRFAAATPLMGTRYLHSHIAAEPDYCFKVGASQAVGESVVFDAFSCNNYIPLVEGIVEPDADGDGYGDETQDLCVTDATRHDQPCFVPFANLAIKAVRSTAKTSTSATRVFVVTNTGTVATGPLKFRIKASKTPKKLSIIKGCRPDTSAKKRTCTISALAAGASVSVKVLWTPKSVLRVALTATVTTMTPESSLTDNKAMATVKAKTSK